MPPLNWVDYGIIALIGLSGLISLTRGLVQEVFSLVAWGAAFWLALHFSRDFSAHLETAIPLPAARLAAAFALLFFAGLALAGMAAFVLNKLVRGIGLGGIDRLAGLVFGVIRGVLVVAILVLAAGLTPLPKESWWKQSKLIPPFQSLALWLRGQIPADYYASRFKSPISFH